MAKVVVLGAGIAGLSAGWMLKQQGIEFIVLEKRPYPGGLARSFEWNGFFCDFAAHRLFTTDENVLQELLKLVPMGRHVRRSKIFLRGQWMRDPLDVLELGGHLSLRERIRVLWTYISRPRNMPEDSFANFVLKRYGAGLYEYFFKPYTEKLFGIPGDEISVLWARQKVRLASPLDKLKENTKTKFQYFYYPIRGGYGAIANRLYDDICDHVQLDATVTGLDTQDGQIQTVRYIKDEQAYEEQVDVVISTLPLTITGKMLGHSLPLQFQKVDSVYLHINRPLLSDHHWIYFIDDDIAINRMVEFKNMSVTDTPDNTTVVCAEVTQYHDDVVEKVVADLVRVGLLSRDEVLDTKVVREEFSYPVYNRAYEASLKDAQAKLGVYRNLFTVGRAAEFRHREIDDNFAAAAAVVGEISEQFSDVNDVQNEGLAVLKESDEQALPVVVAVMLAWNNYDDTQESLSTLFESDYANFRVILVDNGSEDGTPQKVREVFPNVEIIENGQNLGVPAGYNAGFERALQTDAEYILLLNNDIAIPPDMLSKLVEVGEDDASIGMVMPKVLYYGSDDDVWSSGGRYRAFPPVILMTDNRKDAANRMRLIEYAPSCTLLIHRRAFELAGLFDPGYLFLFDDWDFSERVRAHGLNIWYAPDARVWHKVSRSTKGPSSPLWWKTFAASGVRFYRRHGRPVWLSLPIHIGYVFLREIVWKMNWRYARYFWEGVRDGMQKPLGGYPEV